MEAIRPEFPALRRTAAGVPVAYFDGPGGTQVPDSVVEAVAGYLIRHNANTHWRYPSSEETDAVVAAGRTALADLVGGAADEIAFGANMTTLTLHLARGLGRCWGPGDEVVVTELDHHANVAPWRALEAERGITVRTVPLRPNTGELDRDALARAVNPRTRLVAIGAASNALGTVTDVAVAADCASRVGALTFVDAVHYAPHELVDVRLLGCDFLACSAYKLYGPHVGVLWGRRERLAAVDVPRLAPAPDTVPERVESGTGNHEGIAGATAAVDFLAGLADGGSRRERLARTYAELAGRGRDLLGRLWEGLGAIRGVRLHGPTPDRPRTPTLAFTVEGWVPGDAAARLSSDGLFVTHGDFYAPTVMERLGLASGGALRVGCACYTTAEEVDRLVTGVRALRRAGPV